MTEAGQKRADIASRHITPFIVMEILERAQTMEAAGRRVVHMEIGEPDFPTPKPVVEAGRAALAESQTKYTHSLGMFELRQAIADLYKRDYGVDVDPNRTIVTTGSSGGMLLVFAALIDCGDKVAITDPSYPCYSNFIKLFGGEPEYITMGEDEGWQINADRFERAAAGSKAAVVNSPANPTGIVLTPDVLRDIAAAAGRLGLPVISDEIYHGMVYEGRAASMLEFSPEAIVINGFSKLYAMTGWRLGWIIVPEYLVKPIQALQQNLFISAPTISQKAALAAVTSAGPDIARMVSLYDQRRRWLVPRLRELGFGIAAVPTGAFYILANTKHLSSDSYSLAFEILENAGVALTPGIDFGRAAEGYLRFSYANSLDELKEGCRRLEAWLKKR